MPSPSQPAQRLIRRPEPYRGPCCVCVSPTTGTVACQVARFLKIDYAKGDQALRDTRDKARSAAKELERQAAAVKRAAAAEERAAAAEEKAKLKEEQRRLSVRERVAGVRVPPMTV